ncbi:MAG: glycosyltransferase [Acidobacteria bacterium]|nr:glycosyltransferase [Acidobacteriota bacterium]
MRILQLANFYSPASGGLRTALRALAGEYRSLGHQVVRVVPGEVNRSYDDGTAEVVEVASPSLGATGYRIIRPSAALHRQLRDLCIDAVELSDKSTLVGVAADLRTAGARVVLVSHERLDHILAGQVPRGFPLARVTERWNRRLAARVDAVVAASAFAADEFVRINAPHVHRVPLGVDLATFRPSPVRPADGTLRLAMVGRLSAEKSPAVGIEAVRHLAGDHDVRLTVAGDGPLADELRRRAHGLPVTFVGHLRSRDEVARLLGESDAVLAPCGCETFGLGALEAMACGTPVVAADTGALPELVVPGTGLVTAANGPSFAAAALTLASSGRDVSAVFARAHAERHTWSAAARRMLELLAPGGGRLPIGRLTERGTR